MHDCTNLIQRQRRAKVCHPAHPAHHHVVAATLWRYAYDPDTPWLQAASITKRLSITCCMPRCPGQIICIANHGKSDTRVIPPSFSFCQESCPGLSRTSFLIGCRTDERYCFLRFLVALFSFAIFFFSFIGNRIRQLVADASLCQTDVTGVHFASSASYLT